jgi:monothiol glutaredoxin
MRFFPGVKYASRNVLEDPELREGIKQFTSWPTIPQVGRNR